jgi:RNA polymerase sigma factor (sigma-70 family)
MSTGYLLYLTKNWAIAEDLTGETFEAAFKKWRRFDPSRGTPRAWLLAIARSTALDWFRADARRRKREERAEAVDPRVPDTGSFGEGFSPELARACSRSRPASARSSHCASFSISTARRPHACSGSPSRPCLDAAQPSPVEARREDERP